MRRKGITEKEWQSGAAQVGACTRGCVVLKMNMTRIQYIAGAAESDLSETVASPSIHDNGGLLTFAC